MKLIVNNREIAKYLVTLVDVSKSVPEIPLNDFRTAETLHNARIEIRKGKFQKKKFKIKEKIKLAVEQDTREYVVLLKAEIEKQKNKINLLIRKKIDQVIDRLGSENVLKNYKNSNVTGFIKGGGLNIDPHSQLIRRKNYSDYSVDCFFRNMEGNEEMLLTKMNNNWPFWFIDTGYTNFLNGKRKDWHRLTRNHLHHIKPFEAPVDRLGIFEKFPQQWRNTGEKILIIEPGSFSAKTFNIDIDKWKKDIEIEIKQYTDKPIVFREKHNKKIRTSLYKHLCDEDYYCLININSNAAIESIWAGIPVITLAPHISNTVSRNKISDINNLVKPNLANWLCMLSYSQFTYDEIVNGTASNIVKKYHV